MGRTLSKAFAQFYVHHSADIESFLAAYLMNIEHNEEVLKEKLNIFGNLTWIQLKFFIDKYNIILVIKQPMLTNHLLIQKRFT